MEGYKLELNKSPKPFKKGEFIYLKKISLNEGQKSDIESGVVLHGSLVGDVKVGDSARLSNGSQTSTVQSIYEKDGKTFLETRTSVYEINRNEVSDLNIQNELGSVYLPEDAKLADLSGENLDRKFDSPDKSFEFYINKEALRGILLQVNGGELFKGGQDMQGRFFVVCKVGNIHLPYYVSSAGHSGKKQGEWYPFFGVTPTWLVKGEVNAETGEIYHHKEISRVQNLLNNNFKIPASGYISPKGLFGSGKGEGVEPSNVWLDLNNHIKYQNGFFFENETNEDHTKRVTGYDPKKVLNDKKGSAHKWIDNVVKSIN